MSRKERENFEERIENLKGKPFTISVSNGRKYRLAVYELKGEHIVLRSVRKARDDRATVYGNLTLSFPVSFFMSLLYGTSDLEDLSDILD